MEAKFSQRVKEVIQYSREEAIRLGLILGKAGFRKNILKVKPPLIVSQEECDEILTKFRDALRKVLRK